MKTGKSLSSLWFDHCTYMRLAVPHTQNLLGALLEKHKTPEKVKGFSYQLDDKSASEQPPIG